MVAVPADARTRVSGPIFNLIHRLIGQRPEYRSYCDGELPHSEFALFLDMMAPTLIAAGLPPGDVHFAKRMPRNRDAFVASALADLARNAVIPTPEYDRHRCSEMIAATNHYDHGGYPTYIYPEEAILLFALGDILKPRRAAFLGSYYGYWASWVLPGILERGGRAVLIDPDENAQRVAQANLGKFGSSGGVEFATITGERFLDDTPDNFDLVVIDAENPRDHPDPEQRGKRVYAPLLRHALPRLAPGAVVVCHNILLKNTLQGEFFQALLARNEDELGPFMALAGCELESFTEFTSTEGVGVGRRALS